MLQGSWVASEIWETIVIQVGPYMLDGFQERTINSARSARSAGAAGKKRILIVAPTGFGKTILTLALAQLAAEKGKVLDFHASGRQLIHQASQKAKIAGLPHSVWMAGEEQFNFRSPFRIISKDTMESRVDSSPWIPGSISVVDEVDMCTSGPWQAIHNQYEFLIGLTATPCDGSGRGLGAFFDEMIIGAQYSELFKSGRLVDIPESKCFSPYRPDLTGAKLGASGDYSSPWLSGRMNTDKLVGNVVDEWLKKGDDLPTLVCCVDKAHTVHVCEEFNGRGINAEYVIDDTPIEERDHIFELTLRGVNKVIVNCAALTRGFDLPCISCLIIAKPTKRLRTYLQMVGRVLRASPGKTYAIIIDHSGAIWRHGWPTEDRDWPLDGSTTVEEFQKKDKNPKAAVERWCPQCGAMIRYAVKCPNCGYAHPVRSQRAETVDGQLVNVKKETVKKAKKQTDEQSLWMRLLASFARCGKTYGCASFVFHKETGKWPEQAGVGPLAQSHERNRQIGSIWPGFIRKRNAGS